MNSFACRVFQCCFGAGARLLPWRTPEVYTGDGSLLRVADILRENGLRRPFGIASRRQCADEHFRRLQEVLDEQDILLSVYSAVEPNPSVETVEKLAAQYRAAGCASFLVLGGGSPIDAAKAMWIKYEYPDITFEDMCKVFGIPPLRRKAHFCAISSTSGTATEVAAISNFFDYQKGIKYPIADLEITPDVAIVDPDLAETMPKKPVAHTGMDAMTHAIEAYVSTAHCDYTDPLAIFAIRMIQGDLVDSYNGDMSKRDSMHNAQCLAGMAFSNALLGIVHSMAHGLSALYDTPHGVACAILLPVGLEYNKSVAGERYRAVGKAMGVKNIDEMNDAAAADATIAAVKQLSADVGIPTNLKGILKEEDIQFLAESAFAAACRPGNPRDTSVEETVELYKSQL